MKALVVEDDFVSRKLLQKILSSYGEADVAVNGKEAVEAYKAAKMDGKPYDLICLDIIMPELDGHETLKKVLSLEESKSLTEDSHKVKIIMTTGAKEKEDVLKAFAYGCEAYIQKPFSKDELLSKLHEIGLLESKSCQTSGPLTEKK